MSRKMEAAEYAIKGGKEDALFVASLAKGLRVLESFHGRRGSLTLKEITGLSQIGSSATQRAVATLHTLGYLAKDEQTKAYKLTPKTLTLCWDYLSNSELHDVALPVIRRLGEQFGETVNLTERLDDELVIVGRFAGRQVLAINVGIGTRYPLVSTAPGLTILANSDPVQVRAFLQRVKIIAWTKHTVTDLDEILAQINKVRFDGFAIASQLMHEGEISVAAPIFGADSSHAIAAINLSAPLGRWTEQAALTELVPAVVASAQLISSSLKQ